MGPIWVRVADQKGTTATIVTLPRAQVKEEGRVRGAPAEYTMSWLTSFTEMLGLDNGSVEGTAFDELAPVHGRKVSG